MQSRSLLLARTRWVIVEFEGPFLTWLKSLAIANKAAFRNCLVAMRPKTKVREIPSMYDIKTHIHNKFVEQLEELKQVFQVCKFKTIHKTNET